MKRGSIGGFAFLAGVGFAMLAYSRPARATTSFVLQSDVQAYFGSQTNVYEASNPTVLPWPAPPVGPYAPHNPLAGVPAPPVAPVWPGSISGNAFSPLYTGNFNDGLTPPTSATFAILAHNNPSPTLVSNDHINLPAMSLVQNAGAPGNAYEQLDFEVDYGVVGSLGAAAPTFPFHLFGTVGAGSTDYAQFDAQLSYYWLPTNNTAFTTSGTPTYLGTLQYSALQLGGGSFNGLVHPTGALLASPTNWGVLEITGYMYVAGDPSSITVSGAPVPEPTSLGLLGFGLVALGRRLRNRRVSAS
ncbi:MAG TPA: PEP-CTERM sorting domain-containing protein [Tepidisphaeraceae bacterium]|nr:PEP-CTERM sorting domain-containing protein [Tepidisphaeraceae bacterium]